VDAADVIYHSLQRWERHGEARLASRSVKHKNLLWPHLREDFH
jgi:hypothetical protein